MGIRTVNELKTFFQTGDKPTQQQFWDLLESFVHRNDGITMANVAGLIAALNGKLDKSAFDSYEQGVLVEYNADAAYAVSEGTVVERVIPCLGNNANLKIRDVVQGADDILPELEVLAGWRQPIELNRVFENAGTLFISGIPPGSKILFMVRKFKKNA